VITEERMKALFEEANPIPDPESVDMDSSESTAYLATLKQRSSKMTKTRDVTRADTTSGARKYTWLIAAVTILLLGVIGFLTWTDGDSPVVADPTLTPEEETVQQFLSTRDYSVFEDLVTDDWLSTNVAATPYASGREMMEGIWANEQMIGAERTLVSCEPVGGQAFNCTMSYTDDIMEAFGEDPKMESTTFTLVEGKVASGLPIGEDPRSGFSRYASATGIQQDFLDACENPPGPSCMQFIMDNLEGWATWETGQ
jgi:hypothetical protein